MSERVLMKCGCVAQGVRVMPDDSRIPACLVHDCFDVADTVPDLTGRIAKCSYRCKSTAPSSFALPFFEYHGPGSPESLNKCKCGYMWIAHQPRWVVRIKLVRRWFAIERHEEIIRKEFHAPEDQKEAYAEREADFFRQQMLKPVSPETVVYSVDLAEISPTKNPLKCQKFQPIGPQEFDRYYCGCMGWD